MHRPVVAVVAEDQTGDGVRGQLVHPGDDVRVDVERDGDRGVAKPLADHLHGHAGLERRGGVAVAQAMKGDPRQASRHHVLLEPLREARRVDGSTIGPGEEKARIHVAGADDLPLGFLDDQVVTERRDRRRVEGQRPRPARLLGSETTTS